MAYTTLINFPFLIFLTLQKLSCRQAFQPHSPEMDAKEKRRKRDRDRYAQMADEKKQEKLKKLREAYQQKKEKICAQQRQIYANMQPEQKKSRIEHINEMKPNTTSKDSIALENPSYIAIEQEVGTSTFPDHRKHVTLGKRQTLLHRRNEEFMTRQRHVSSKQDVSMTETGEDDTEPLQQPEEMIYGNTLNLYNTRTPNKYVNVCTTNNLLWTDIPSSMFPSIKETDTPTQTFHNDDHNKVALWPDIPPSMFPIIKEVDARIQTLYNDDHGKVINFLYIYIYIIFLYI
ncbi:hypothetical protein ZWY2020_005929 [Hordeum vulgare]|nr:hypothetical protein ZWY2020_005929 [Hordeum vulgare]